MFVYIWLLSTRRPSATSSACKRLGMKRCETGLACKGSGRRESAEEYFRLSLELDPLLWVSMQALCELGADVDVEKHFGRKDLMKAMAHAEKVACYAAGSRSEIFKVTARSASFEGAGGGVEIAGGGCTACERRRG